MRTIVILKSILKPGLKKVSTYKIAFYCICLWSFISCGEKTQDCPGFFLSAKDYYPYKVGDVLVFVNQHSDTISLHVDNTYIVEKHTIVTKTGRKYSKCACEEPSFSFRTTYLSGNMNVSETGNYPRSYPNTNIVFSLDNSYWDNSPLTKEIIEYYGYYSVLEKKINEYPVNTTKGSIFGDTLSLSVTGGRQISHAVVVWGKGITEFYDQRYDFQWKVLKTINN